MTRTAACNKVRTLDVRERIAVGLEADQSLRAFAAPEDPRNRARASECRGAARGSWSQLARPMENVNNGAMSDDWKTPAEILGPLDDVEQKHAPHRLWVQGDTSLLTRGARVSVVGSRQASEIGLQRAAKLARLLVSNGVVVVSGLAEGIDAAAHVHAMEAGGKTVAVLGTPLERTFPAKHRGLQERIGREHLLVSQFGPGTKTFPSHFPLRNRTMALLSDATVIVEAGPKSGTLHQGWEALRLGRQLYVLESLANRGFDWLTDLQGHGAQVLSDRNRELFIESLPKESRLERFEQAPF